MREKINSTFRALKHRNYRLFFVGQCLSLVGTWIQQIAMSWLIYSMTKSAMMMGIITFASCAPSLFLSPFAGVLIDRTNKYKLLIAVQSLFMVQAFVLAFLTMSGLIQIWHIILLGAIAGIIAAIDMPLRQSFVIRLVDNGEDLSNAISLNSSSFNLARLLGPAIAGVMIAAVGEGVCFLINAISYIAVIGALFAMRLKPEINIQKKALNIFMELKEGFSYSAKSPPIRNIILYLATISFLGMSFQVLMPIFAKEILNGNAQTLGFLMSASGIGALIGALYLAGKKSVVGLERWICFASFIFGAGLFGISFVSHFYVSMALLFSSTKN